MVNMSNTKAQLLAAYTTVVAESLAQGHTIRALRDELAMAQPVSKPATPAYKDYLVALRDSNRVAFASGAKHNPFPSFVTWCAA